MSPVKFLANENFPYTSFKILKDKNWDIVHISDFAKGISDKEVMAIALSQNRIIITFDSDYGELVFSQGYKPLGVIYLRIKNFLPNYPALFLEDLIIKENLEVSKLFIVIDDN
ncbi:DUF5615 family PIN-like protein [Saprospiraceae bacterium]|nr:DUF5615 family PIN-like protein [Saprospiraceae bacterium]